jgi:hypothetical protein
MKGWALWAGMAMLTLGIRPLTARRLTL